MHYLDVLWPQHEHDQTFTRMDWLIDDMSEEVIADYVCKELIKSVTADDRHPLKKFARKISAFLSRKETTAFPGVQVQALQGFLLESGLQDLNNLHYQTPREQYV